MKNPWMNPERLMKKDIWTIMHDRKDPWERVYERFNEKGLETTNEDDFMRKNYIRKIYEKQMKNIFKNSWVRKDVETTLRIVFINDPSKMIHERPMS